MAFTLTGGDDGCYTTTLHLTGKHDVPEELRDYTDGFKAVVEMQMDDYGAEADEKAMTCW